MGISIPDKTHHEHNMLEGMNPHKNNYTHIQPHTKHKH
jgi:hypothetical protein